MSCCCRLELVPVGAANVPVNSGCCCGSVGDSLAAFSGLLVSSFTQTTLVWAVDVMEVDMGKLGGVLVGGGITKGAAAEVTSENKNKK